MMQEPILKLDWCKRGRRVKAIPGDGQNFKSSDVQKWKIRITCDSLAKFIEAAPLLRWDIRFVKITQIEKGRTYML
jgi:hypothetical protein